MSNNNENKPKKPMYIEITQPEKFEKLAATSLETTQRLAKRINKLFSTAFVDYHGSSIYCTPGNGNVAPYQQFMVEIHFKPLAAGSVNPNDTRIRAFKPIEEGTPKTDIVANLKSIYGNFRSSSKFELTSEAAQILSEFMYPGLTINPFDPKTYDQVKSEYVDTPQYGQSPIMVKLTGLDLTKLIRKIYGSKTEEGKRVDYAVIPFGPVAPNMMNNNMIQGNANWKVSIMQIEAEKTYDLASELGYIPAGNGSVAPIVTGTM